MYAYIWLFSLKFVEGFCVYPWYSYNIGWSIWLFTGSSMQVTLFFVCRFHWWLSHSGFFLEMDLMPLLIIFILLTFSDCYWYLIILFSADFVIFMKYHAWMDWSLYYFRYISQQVSCSTSNVCALCINHILKYCDGIDTRNNDSNEVWKFCFYFNSCAKSLMRVLITCFPSYWDSVMCICDLSCDFWYSLYKGFWIINMWLQL